MAGLCEGGNEPPGSLKASSEIRLRIPAITAGGIIVLTTRYLHSGWMIVHLCFECEREASSRLVGLGPSRVVAPRIIISKKPDRRARSIAQHFQQQVRGIRSSVVAKTIIAGTIDTGDVDFELNSSRYRATYGCDHKRGILGKQGKYWEKWRNTRTNMGIQGKQSENKENKGKSKENIGKKRRTRGIQAECKENKGKTRRRKSNTGRTKEIQGEQGEDMENMGNTRRTREREGDQGEDEEKMGRRGEKGEDEENQGRQGK
ncbi:hypothetical protein ANN_15857 [Periplaneta americana]|uniref:Uncharacterized protein n=1 Tax=Periplaneta americana TaxID=6978 RepID=A0ABQ8SHL1_PERAM|nr:hypothetical protein ANN_15857 [Periplaneta americana]